MINWSNWRADVTAFKLKQPTGWISLLYTTVWCHLFHPQATCVFWLRVNQANQCKLLNAWRIHWFGNDISYRATIGKGLRLPHIHDIVIGGEARIGDNCTILNGVTIGMRKPSETGMPRIGSNVFIGTGAKLLGAISVGDNVTIGALTLVNRDIPSNSVAYGIPPNFVVRPKDLQTSAGTEALHDEFQGG